VLLDGEEVRACIIPISYAVGKQVTTIEGLPAVWAAEKSLSPADAAKTLHPIQQAWVSAASTRACEQPIIRLSVGAVLFPGPELGGKDWVHGHRFARGLGLAIANDI
jgi:hypothetical protein